MFKRKILLGTAVFLFLTVSVHGQTEIEENTGIAASIKKEREDIKEIEDIASETIHDLFNSPVLSSGLSFGFGNIWTDDYSFFGEDGQGSMRANLGVTKRFGLLFISGGISDSIGLGKVSSHQLGTSFTGGYMFPQYNLVTSAQLAFSFPFYDGEYMKDYFTTGITPSVSYNDLFEWGVISLNMVLPLSRTRAADGWNVMAAPSIGVDTVLGIGVSATPVFTFLLNGEKDKDVFTSFDLDFSYSPAKIPLDGSVTFTIPGNSEARELMGYDMDFQVSTSVIPSWFIYLSVGIQNIGNTVEKYFRDNYGVEYKDIYGVDWRNPVIISIGATYRLRIPLFAKKPAQEVPDSPDE